MNGKIAGIGRNADFRSGTCRITMTGETDQENEFLRAFFHLWFDGPSEERDAILVENFSVLFLKAGWSRPAS